MKAAVAVAGQQQDLSLEHLKDGMNGGGDSASPVCPSRGGSILTAGGVMWMHSSLLHTK